MHIFTTPYASRSEVGDGVDLKSSYSKGPLVAGLVVEDWCCGRDSLVEGGTINASAA
jgi:hypothetical protein